MPHDHSHGHDHGHVHLDPTSGDRRVSFAIWANGLLTVAQIVGGVLSGSLALVADALHNLSDMASFGMAFGARKIARRPADERMTFGYGRIEIVAALINYTTLVIVGVYLIFEGVMRMTNPPPVQGWTVVVLGAIGILINAATTVLIYRMQRDSVNIRALFLHNLSDALASFAVVIGGMLILLYDMRWVDPAVTIGIALYILYMSLTEIGGPIRTLMLGSPEGMDGSEVIAAMRGVNGVEDVHHVHLWQMSETQGALDCHVVLAEASWQDLERIKTAIKAALSETFGIAHSSLEFEHVDCAHENAQLFGHPKPEAQGHAHDHDHGHDH